MGWREASAPSRGRYEWWPLTSVPSASADASALSPDSLFGWAEPKTVLAKKHIIWKDCDGNILNEFFVAENEEIPSYKLPQSDDKWTYERWDQSNDGMQIIYQAVRSPNTNFFIGNVFQIVVKDNKGEPLGSGSGFIINDQGWFITNNHVMEDGYSATAFFDIKDSENGQQYTQLKIIGGVYHDDKKDVFIGKIKSLFSKKENNDDENKEANEKQDEKKEKNKKDK